MAEIIDGKFVAQTVYVQLTEEVRCLKEQYKKPIGLAVILVGEDPASKIYVGRKEKMANKIGLESHIFCLPHNTTEGELLNLVQKLNQDPHIYGILVQLPLPKHINEQDILHRISPQKDVDGFTPENTGKLVLGFDVTAKPCTPLGIMRLLDYYKINLEGKNALVIGRSNIVGKPISTLLLSKNATVTTAHSRTQNLPQLIQQADILVSAIGKPHFVQGEWIKEGAVVIDVGINRHEDGTLVGDVDFENAAKKAGYITPVPGGVGPMTIAMLLTNCVNLFKKAHVLERAPH